MSSLDRLLSEVRNVPVQQRSTNRMEALLDAAARIIDEDGIEAVTTTSVAYRSDSSVGVIYRYFPNINSLLQALARRNLQRYLERVQEGSDLTPDEPWSSWDLTLDSYVHMYRTEPSFRSLRFGDIITERFLSSEESNTSVIAKAFAGMVSETHSIPVTKEMLFHLEVAIAMGSALVALAFEHSAKGDKAIIEQARTVIGDYLRSNLPIRATS